MVNADVSDGLYREILLKKMNKNTWRKYWVILREDRLLFINENGQKIAGIIKLTEKTTCKVLGRKSSERINLAGGGQTKSTIEHNMQGKEDGTFKFKLYAKKGVHLLKTDCKSSCVRWIEAISRAVQNLWDMNCTHTAHSGPSAPLYHGKHGFKYRLQKDVRNTWASLFGYTALTEEDENTGEKERGIENTTGIQTAILPRIALTKRGKFHKWINFPSHLRTRCNPVNYEVLIEDITN